MCARLGVHTGAVHPEVPCHALMNILQVVLYL